MKQQNGGKTMICAREPKYNTKVAYDKNGNLHLLVQEGQYVEDEDVRELDVVIIEFTFSHEGMSREMYVFQAMQDNFMDDMEDDDYE
jgi:hypothetical protein